MDDAEVHQLKAELQDARRRAEDATTQAEERERQAEERERQAGERERQAEDKRRQAEAATQPTHLHEFLALYAQHIPPPTAQDKALSTQGGTVPPKGRMRPDKVRPWTKFHEQQSDILGIITSILPPQVRAFQNKAYIQELGRALEKDVVSSENGIYLYQDKAAHMPVASIMRELQNHPEAAASYGYKTGSSFRFETHYNSVPAQRKEKPPFDHICIVSFGDDLPALVIGGESKAPHKLTCEQIRAGFGEMNRAGVNEMDMLEIMNRVEVPPKDEKGEIFRHRSEELVAAMLTQTYDYMVRSGLQNAWITTGLSYIFLMIDYEHPEILLCHLAEPDAEVAEQRESQRDENAPYCTAVAQLLSVCSIAMQREPLSAERCAQTIASRPVWEVDIDTVLNRAWSSSPILDSSSPFRSRVTYPTVNRTPRVTRQQGCRPETQGPPSSRNSSPGSSPPESPTPRRKRIRGTNDGPDLSRQSSEHRKGKGGSGSDGISSEGAGRTYCTHECIQGLAQDLPMDMTCPNFHQHPKGLNDHHSLGVESFRSALKEPSCLRQCVAFAVGGSSIAFRVAFRGYTLVAKGSKDPSDDHKLESERNVYANQLKENQGLDVPVCLGLIALHTPCFHWWYSVSHLLLLSWAGLSGACPKSDQKRVKRNLRQAGITGHEGRYWNFCWDSVRGKAMAIDFADVRSLDLRPVRIRSLKRKYSTDYQHPTLHPRRRKTSHVR